MLGLSELEIVRIAAASEDLELLSNLTNRGGHKDGEHLMVDDDLLEDGAYTKRGGQYDHYKTVLSLPKY
jgi:hypothetical protein